MGESKCQKIEGEPFKSEQKDQCLYIKRLIDKGEKRYSVTLFPWRVGRKGRKEYHRKKTSEAAETSKTWLVVQETNYRLWNDA